jgi:hypothetical protein
MVQNLPPPTVQGFDGIATSINTASAAMTAAAAAIAQASTTNIQADKIKELSEKKAAKEAKLEEIINAANSDGKITAFEARNIQMHINDIGELDREMSGIASQMTPAAREAMGPEFGQALTDAIASHALMESQGYGALGPAAIKDLGPTIARGFEAMNQTENLTGTTGSGALSMSEAQSILQDTYQDGTSRFQYKRDRIQEDYRNEGSEKAIQRARNYQQSLQSQMMMGTINEDEAKFRMAAMQEMINRIETGTVTRVRILKISLTKY